MKKIALIIFSILGSAYLPAQDAINKYTGTYTCIVKKTWVNNPDPTIHVSYDTSNVYVSIDNTLEANQLLFVDSTIINDPYYIVDKDRYTVTIDTTTNHFLVYFLYGGVGDFFLTSDSIQMYISGGSGLWGAVAWYYYGKKTVINAITDYEPAIANIFPNPAKNILKIELLNRTKSANCFIYSLNGHLILSRKFIGNTTINVSNLPRGMYIAEIVSERKQFLRKIIIY